MSRDARQLLRASVHRLELDTPVAVANGLNATDWDEARRWLDQQRAASSSR